MIVEQVLIYEENKDKKIKNIYLFMKSNYKCDIYFNIFSLSFDIDDVEKELKKNKSSYNKKELSEVKSCISFNVDKIDLLDIGLKNFSHYIDDAYLEFFVNNERVLKIVQNIDEGAIAVCNSVLKKELIQNGCL